MTEREGEVHAHDAHNVALGILDCVINREAVYGSLVVSEVEQDDETGYQRGEE
jgi:hypothetical protein